MKFKCSKWNMYLWFEINIYKQIKAMFRYCMTLQKCIFVDIFDLYLNIGIKIMFRGKSEIS